MGSIALSRVIDQSLLRDQGSSTIYILKPVAPCHCVKNKLQEFEAYYTIRNLKKKMFYEHSHNL